MREEEFKNEIDRLFKTELGKNLDVLYVTPDNRVFLKHEDAEAHIKESLNDNKINLVGQEIRILFKGDQ